MIDPKLIERINLLANKKKTVGLTEEEQKEQDELRKEYLKLFKEGFRQRLESITIEKGPKDNENN